MFKDRYEAARKLANLLDKYKGQEGIVLAIPRGGVPVGYHIAQSLEFPLDVALIKKIGHPQNKEFAVGAVNIKDKVVNQEVDVSKEYVEDEVKHLQHELQERYNQFTGGRKQLIDIENKLVIITDDGVATGSTMLATIQLVKKENPKRIIIAIPIAPPRTIKKFESEVDEIICPYQPENFMAVGQFYDNFEQVNDDDAIRMLHEAENFKKA